MTTNVPITCPRCRSTTTRLHAESATPGVWSMFGCDTCFYTWRSTESARNTDPDHYPAVFRLSPLDIPRLPVVPAIPPLKLNAGKP